MVQDRCCFTASCECRKIREAAELLRLRELEEGPEARSRMDTRVAAYAAVADAAVADAAIELDFHGWRTFHGKAFRDVGGIFTEVVGTVVGTFTYVGEFNAKTMKAEGHGLLKMSRGGPTWSVELASGKRDGCALCRNPGGDIGYFQYERGKAVHTAWEYPDGRTEFESRPCDADRAEFGKLKAAALVVEVRPVPCPQTRTQPEHKVGRGRPLAV